MTKMTMIRKVVDSKWSVVRQKTNYELRITNYAIKSKKQIRISQSAFRNRESGMSLIVVMAVMTLFAIALLAVAPTVQQSMRREREIETIRRGEEVASAIREYILFYKGKLPDSMDDLLEGLPQGTKKRQILRPSAAIDPLSDDGKWRLISPQSKVFLNFGRHVQIYNNGVLPASGSPLLDNHARALVNILNTETEEDLKAPEEEIEIVTDKTPFIGVTSQSRATSIIAYYGVENHSKWIFTPLFRGSSANAMNMGGSVNFGTNTQQMQQNTNSRRPINIP